RKTERISWYDGTTDEGLEKLIADSFSLPSKTRFILIDSADNTTIALSSSLPSGIELQIQPLEGDPSFDEQRRGVLNKKASPDPDEAADGDGSGLQGQEFQGELLKFERVNAHLANERTWLAWVRTALAVLSSAFTFLGLTEDFASGTQIFVFVLGCFYIGNVLLTYGTGWLRYAQVREILGLPGSMIKPKFNRFGLSHQARYLAVLLLVTGSATGSAWGTLK
ncbi:unnamed protein product, partial [Heterosigma akashiwo]